MVQSHNHYQYPSDYHEHDDGREVFGHTHADGDKFHEHTEPPAPLKAERLSEKESMEIEAAERKAEEEKLTAKRLEELKTSKWTVDDLKTLLFEVGNNGYGYLNGADIKNIQTMQIEAQKGILDKHYGDPVELQTDLTMLEEVEAHDDIVIIKNGKREKKEKLPPQVLDSLYAMVITNHILGQNFILTVDKDRQPLVTDNENSPDPKRQADRQAQAKNLETTLRQKNNGDTPLMREWQGDKITKPDGSGSRVIPKINTYITTGAFLAMNMPDIGSHDDLSKAQYNASSGEKNLHEYRNTLLGKMSGKVDEKSIKESDLTAGEKSFLLAWKNENDDGIFSGIRDRQAAGFLNILSNPTYKTVEQKGAENSKNFISNNYGKIIFGAVGIVAFISGLSMLFGRKSKIWQRVLGGFMALSVGAFGAKTLDSLIDKTGLYAQGVKIANGTPKEATGVLNTAPKSIDMNIISPIKEKWGRVLARTAGSSKGIELLTNPAVGDEVGTKYPVYSMLHALNPGDRGLTGAYTAPNEIGQPSIATIDGTLTKLDTIHDRPALNTILQDTWRKYRNTPNFNIDTAKTVTLNEMLTEIDKNENWMDDLINIGTAEKSKEALQIIAQHPVEWSQIPAYELRKFFDPFDEKTVNLSPVSPVHGATILKILNATQVNPGEDAREIIKNYLGTIMRKNESINTTMTFRESVTKKDEKVS